MRAFLSGRVVAYNEESYNGYTKANGHTVPPGVSRSLWLIGEDGGSPHEVRVSQDCASAMRAASIGEGDNVEVACSIRVDGFRQVLGNAETIKNLGG